MLEIQARQVPTGSWGGKETRPKLQVRERLHSEERAPEKGKSQSKPQNTSPKGKNKGNSTGKGKQSKDQAFIRKGNGKGKTRNVSEMEIPTKEQRCAW